MRVAIENFTTEALAAAVRRAPGPLGAALVHVGAPRRNLAEPWTLVEISSVSR